MEKFLVRHDPDLFARRKNIKIFLKEYKMRRLAYIFVKLYQKAEGLKKKPPIRLSDFLIRIPGKKQRW